MPQPTGKQGFGERLSRERRLKQVRDDCDIENQDIAEAVGVDPATAGRWLRGDSIPGDAVLVRLAAYFGVTPAWLRYGQLPREAELIEKPAPPFRMDTEIPEVTPPDVLKKAAGDDSGSGTSRAPAATGKLGRRPR